MSRSIESIADTMLDGPWVWRQLGGKLMLTTAHGGAQIILVHGRRQIETRDLRDGLLRPIRPEDEIARMIEATPHMLAALQAAERWLYNGFEPDNQSNAHRVVCAAIAAAVGDRSERQRSMASR